jgi:transcription elongation factor GreA
MSSGNIYLTKAGYEKLSQELEKLKNKRKEISKAIGEARAHGDLSENAEYDAAKEAQALNEKKIAELEEKLSRARILEEKDIPQDQIFLGATVTLRDLDTGEEFQYTLVSEMEADLAENKISITSPVGKGLLKHKVGEIVEIKVPAGILSYQILKIER